MGRATLRFDPSFVEEAVFLNIQERTKSRPDPLASGFWAQRNRIYEDCASEQSRDIAFGELCTRFFTQLELRSCFEQILAEFPLLAMDPGLDVFIKRVWTRKHEEVQLYVNPPFPPLAKGGEGGFFKTVLVGLQALRTLQRLWLQAFLRFEFLHVADMLDPAFGYSPDVSLGGTNEIQDELIRERFRLLWDHWTQSRLRRRGYEVPMDEAKQREILAKVFAHWDGEKRQMVFNRIAQSDHFTQGQLLQTAHDLPAISVEVIS